MSLTVRPLTPADAAAVRRCFESLSPETRYRRYGRAGISANEALSWVADLGGRRACAVARRDRATGATVGAARYVCDGLDTAELAVTVTDAWQGRGVGGTLLAALLMQARSNGVRELHAQIMADNRPAIRLMARIGGRRAGPSGGGVIDFVTERLIG